MGAGRLVRAAETGAVEGVGERAWQAAGPRAGALLEQAGHELRTPLNAICGFAELALSGGLGPVAAPLREALLAMAHGARALQTTAETIEACRHALPREPRPKLPVALATALGRAGFDVVAASGEPWPTVWAEAERLEAGLAAARRWLCRPAAGGSRARARLSATATSCVIEATRPLATDEGLGALDLSLACVLLAADGIDARPCGRDLELVWAACAREAHAPRASGANFSA